MKLPSFTQLYEESSAAFRRFPFVLVNAFIGTIAAVILIGTHSDEFRSLNNILVTTALGLPLLTALATSAEKNKWSSSRRLMANLIGLVVLLGYWFSLPRDVFSGPTEHTVRFLVLNIGLHLLVSFAAYSSRGEANGFWQFNRSLFLRFLTALLHSSVLYIGLAIAIASVDHLFEVHIDGDLYGQVWVIIVGVFNTWFFLAGLPTDLRSLEGEISYPRGLKIFTQYILLPLVLVYLVILYAYMAKIIIQWEWPKGYVSNLILGFSATGVFSLLLLWPIQDRSENTWIRNFSRRFYLALIPLVVMLLLAIGMRLSDYGMTENRFYVLIMGVWLAGVVLYFLLSKTKSIKIIPVSLCIIAFLSAYGPWSASSTSQRSQLERLESLLTTNGMLREGTIVSPENKPSYKETKEISAVVKYINDFHGVSPLQPYFTRNLDSLTKPMDSLTVLARWERPKYIVRLMGIQYIDEWQSDQGENFSIQASQTQSISVAGYEHLFQQLNFNLWDSVQKKSVDGVDYSIMCRMKSATMVVTRLSDSARVEVDLRPMLESIFREESPQTSIHDLKPERLTFENVGERLKAKIILMVVNGKKAENQLILDFVGGAVLVGSRKP